MSRLVGGVRRVLCDRPAAVARGRAEAARVAADLRGGGAGVATTRSKLHQEQLREPRVTYVVDGKRRSSAIMEVVVGLLKALTPA